MGICWDQWFPEVARALALNGAEVIVYPTAIGSEPMDPEYDSAAHWQRVMQGHAGANLVPVVAANRIGTEVGSRFTLTFYGSSFIAGPTGERLPKPIAQARQFSLQRLISMKLHTCAAVGESSAAAVLI